MLSKIFNTLEKIASDNKRILQAHDTMEKAAVTGGLRALLMDRKAYIADAIRRNPKLTRQQARNNYYKQYGLQAGKGGKISAVKDANLSGSALELQHMWLSNIRRSKRNFNAIKKLKSKEQHGTTGPAPAEAPVGNGVFNNNWWKYGLAGVGGALLGRTTAPNPQPMPIMMPPQPMPAMMYNGMQY
jgi:hypothetical protein